MLTTEWQIKVATHILLATLSISGDLPSLLTSAFGPLTVLQSEIRGIREFRSALVEQSLRAADEPGKRVLLVVQAPLMTSARLRQDWEQFTSLLQPRLTKQLALAALSVDGPVTAPTDPVTQRAVEFLRLLTPRQKPSRPYRWDRKRFEVFGVLLDAWLEKEEPLPIGELLRRAGVSHPTASVTVETLTSREEVLRTKSRSVELARLPRRSLEELVPRLSELRETHFYVDGSGREASPESLLARLRRKSIRGLHVGGVAAAREYWPGFNLNGLPRVDVTAAWDTPPVWLHSLDPALQREPQASPRVILAVHHSRAPLAPDASRARRATVVFDLYCLGLSEQAEEFIWHSRQ